MMDPMHVSSRMSRTTSLQLPAQPEEPQPFLTNDEVVSRWLASPGFQAFWAWIRRRCDTVRGRDIMGDEVESKSAVSAQCKRGTY